MNLLGDIDGASKYYNNSLQIAIENHNYDILYKSLMNLTYINYVKNNSDNIREIQYNLNQLQSKNLILRNDNIIYIKYFINVVLNKININYDSSFYYFK